MAIAGRSYTNTPVISRGSLQDPTDFDTTRPIVVAARPDQRYFAVNTPQQTYRNAPQGPLALATAPPVVETSQPSPFYSSRQNSWVITPQASAPLTATVAPELNITTQPPDSRWFRSGSQVIRAPQPTVQPTTQPVEPVVSTSQPAQSFFKTASRIILPLVQAPPPPSARAAPPVVVSVSSRRYFQPSYSFVTSTSESSPPSRTPQHLGGTVTVAELGGAIVVAANTFGGNVVIGTIDAAISILALNGSIVVDESLAGSVVSDNGLGGNTALITPGLGGGADEWTMQEVDITLNEFNDMSCALTITKNSAAYNLTGLEVDMFLKTAAGVPDTDPSTIKLSTTTGEITITNPSGGLATAVIPDADMASTTIGFYRVDVLDGSGNRNTALFGKVTIIPL